MRIISRTHYLNAISAYKGKHLIKVLVGQRRVGKTTILRQIASNTPPEQKIEINMEDTQYAELLVWEALENYLEVHISKGIQEIYIDEVQMISGWDRVVNSIFSKYSEVDIFLTGSNSELLSSEISTLLRGRFITFEIFPFSYSEYCEYFKLEPSSISWRSFMEKGTTPIHYMLADPQLISEWSKNLINTIFLKDIVERYRIKDAHILEEVFLFFVNNIGNITSLTSMMRTLKGKHIDTNLTTLGSYMEYIKNTFLIYEAPLYDLRGKQIFGRERKLYLSDPLYRKVFFSGYDAGLGKILENLIYLEARRKWYKVSVGRIGEQEIDFVLERAGIRKYIQVAYLLADESVIQREFGNLRDIHDSWEKYVISLDEVSFGVIDGIHHIQAWKIEEIL